MSSLTDAQSLIDAFTEIEKSYTRNIPEEIKSNTDTTIALIKAVRTDAGMSGNQDLYSVEREVQVQIFYSDSIDYNPEDLEEKILKKFHEEHWDSVEAPGIDTDPDTFQLYESFYFRKEKYI